MAIGDDKAISGAIRAVTADSRSGTRHRLPRPQVTVTIVVKLKSGDAVPGLSGNPAGDCGPAARRPSCTATRRRPGDSAAGPAGGPPAPATQVFNRETDMP